MSIELVVSVEGVDGNSGGGVGSEGGLFRVKANLL